MSGACGARTAVAYIRHAADEPEPVAVPELQRVAIEAWGKREQVEIRSWQVDVGVDGATPIAERPGLMAAYRALHEVGADMLVAANVDRFGHDELVCWLVERAALTQGATVHTADGSRRAVRRDVPEVGWTRGAIDLARAYERVTRGARIRASLAAKRGRGERTGNVPYGYRLSSDGVHIEPAEGELAVVAAVRRLAAEGLSQRAIVSRLAAHGVVGRTGAPLGQTQVAKILRSVC